MRNASYWILVVLLLGAGIVTIFSFGLIFLFLGLALLVLAPFRSRPRVFWSGLAVVVGFLIGYLAVAPAWCRTSAVAKESQEPTGPVVCRRLLAGALAALGAGTVTWVVIDRSATA